MFLISFFESIICSYLFELNDVFDKIIIAVVVTTINYIVLPLIKKLFNYIKNKIRTRQKTPENDGEISDIIIDGIDRIEDGIIDILNFEVFEDYDWRNYWYKWT